MTMHFPPAEPAPDGDVIYVERWHERRREPILGFRWLTAEDAEERYRRRRGDPDVAEGAGRGDLNVVDAAVRDADGRPRPRWALGVGFRGVRVRFFTPGGGSIWREVDYDAREGRLWRWNTVEYVYPDDEHFYGQNKSTRIDIAKFEPDGTGYVDFNDKSKPTVDRARMTDAPVAGFWLDWPEFGHWQDLANPDYGLPPAGSPRP